MQNNDIIFGTDFFSLEDELAIQEDKLELREGELREVAVLFADIKGFSSISNLFDAETIHKKMDEIMKIFTKCIVFYGGVVDKYMGDGIMALFGAKKATEQDTERSIHAALKMQQQLNLYNSLLARQPGFENLSLGLRIGINTGLVSVGKIGQSRGEEFTVYGPQVNLASRMESNAPVNRIMMPAHTKKLVERIFDFEHQGSVQVKGFEDPIDAWLVVGAKLESSLHRRNQEVRYVGRERELGLLQSYLEQVESRTADTDNHKVLCVSIKGEAGLGKTRLVYEFERSALDRIRVLQGACSAVIPSPLNLFTSMFENLFRLQINEPTASKKSKYEAAFGRLMDRADTEQRAVLSDVKALIAFLLELKYPDERLKQSGADLLSHLSRAIEQFLILYIKLYLDEDKSLVVILDDLHWIDEASAKVMENLLNTISRDAELQRLFFMLLHRPDYEIPGFLGVLMDHKELELSPLTESDIRRLVDEFTQGYDVSEDTIGKVVSLSEGNPFFLEEWCNFIDELPKDQLKDFPVPVSLHSMILTRLDKLSPELRMILHKASVIGHDFFVDILKAVENRLKEPIDIDGTLRQLEEQSIILKMMGFDYPIYYFKHLSTREVAYQTLLMENRKMLHQLTGEAIEDLFSDRKDEFLYILADHFLKADLRDKAIPYLQRSAEAAARIYNNKQALSLYTQLLSVLTDSSGLQRLEIRFKIAEIQWMTGNWKDAVPEVIKIHEDLEALGEHSRAADVLEFELHRFLGIASFYKADIDTAFTELNRCKYLAQEYLDAHYQCVASSNLGNWYYQSKDFEKARELQSKGLDLARELGDLQRQAKILSNLGLIELESGNYSEAEKLTNESLQIAIENRFMKEESIALGNLGYIMMRQDKPDEAIPFHERKLALAEAMNDKLELLKALGNLGNIAKSKEQYLQAIGYFEKISQIRLYLGDEEGRQRVEKEIASMRLQTQNQP